MTCLELLRSKIVEENKADPSTMIPPSRMMKKQVLKYLSLQYSKYLIFHSLFPYENNNNNSSANNININNMNGKYFENTKKLTKNNAIYEYNELKSNNNLFFNFLNSLNMLKNEISEMSGTGGTAGTAMTEKSVASKIVLDNLKGKGIVLSGLELNAKDLRVFSEWLANAPARSNITQIDLSNNALTEEGLRYLLAALFSHTGIIAVDISHNKQLKKESDAVQQLIQQILNRNIFLNVGYSGSNDSTLDEFNFLNVHSKMLPIYTTYIWCSNVSPAAVTFPAEWQRLNGKV